MSIPTNLEKHESTETRTIADAIGNVFPLNDRLAPYLVVVDVFHLGKPTHQSAWVRPPSLCTGRLSVSVWGGDTIAAGQAERRLMFLGYQKVRG